MAARTSAWVGGAAVVALAIAAGAYFVVINPTLTNAESQRQAAADQRDHNAMLEIQIAKLKSEYAHLDDYKAELVALRVKAPEQADLSELTREIQSVGDLAGVTLTVNAPGTPKAFIAPAAPAPAPTATESATDAATSDTTADTSSSSSSSTPTSVAGFFQIPISVTSVGTYDQTVAFLDSLQQSMPRLYVISEVDATSLEESGASGGRPAVAKGDLETVITGYVLTLQDGASSETPTPDGSATPTPAPTQLPVPSGQRNPFEPVANS